MLVLQESQPNVCYGGNYACDGQEKETNNSQDEEIRCFKRDSLMCVTEETMGEINI